MTIQVSAPQKGVLNLETVDTERTELLELANELKKFENHSLHGQRYELNPPLKGAKRFVAGTSPVIMASYCDKIDRLETAVRSGKPAQIDFAKEDLSQFVDNAQIQIDPAWLKEVLAGPKTIGSYQEEEGLVHQESMDLAMDRAEAHLAAGRVPEASYVLNEGEKTCSSLAQRFERIGHSPLGAKRFLRYVDVKSKVAAAWDRYPETQVLLEKSLSQAEALLAEGKPEEAKQVLADFRKNWYERDKKLLDKGKPSGRIGTDRALAVSDLGRRIDEAIAARTQLAQL